GRASDAASTGVAFLVAESCTRSAMLADAVSTAGVSGCGDPEGSNRTSTAAAGASPGPGSGVSADAVCARASGCADADGPGKRSAAATALTERPFSPIAVICGMSMEPTPALTEAARLLPPIGASIVADVAWLA